MNSVLLQIAARYVRYLLIFFACVALIRGHNNPGGGFIGGLLASLAIVYNGFAFNSKKVQEKLIIKPEGYLVSGLMMILLSLLPSLVKSRNIMTGIWIKIPIPLFDEVKLGTPFLFDIGVFLSVIGISLIFFFSLTQSK